MTPPKCENCGQEMEPGTFKEWTCYHCFYYINHAAPDDESDSKEMNDKRHDDYDLSQYYAPPPKIKIETVEINDLSMSSGDFPCFICGHNDETCSMCGKCDNYSCFVDKAIMEKYGVVGRDLFPGIKIPVKDKLFHEERPAQTPEPEQSEENKLVGKMVETFAATFDEDLSSVACSFEGRPAATPEPMSKAGVDDVLPELIKDLEARTAVGVKSYGKPLQTHIGRDPLMDAYQECLDQAQYLKQEIMEREKPFSECIAEWANARKLYDTATPYSQMKKLFEELFEWFEEVKSGDQEAEQVELGDCLVVLQNIANMRNYDLASCGWLAYHKIKDRSGKTIDGTFVKD